MSPELQSLTRLAVAYGIEPQWYDIWGHAHEVSEATLRAALTAMHVATATVVIFVIAFLPFSRSIGSLVPLPLEQPRCHGGVAPAKTPDRPVAYQDFERTS